MHTHTYVFLTTLNTNNIYIYILYDNFRVTHGKQTHRYRHIDRQTDTHTHAYT